MTLDEDLQTVISETDEMEPSVSFSSVQVEQDPRVINQPTIQRHFDYFNSSRCSSTIDL